MEKRIRIGLTQVIMLLEEIKNIKSDKSECRKFGYTVGSVLILIAAILLFYDKSSSWYFGIIGLLLLAAGLIYPVILKPAQKIWMTLAVILGFIMSRVILILLFYLVVTPLGLAAKLLGKDFLDEKIQKERESYWNSRENYKYSHIDTERQF